jgi:twinkle protein
MIAKSQFNYSHITEVFNQAVQEMLSPPIGCNLNWWPKFNEYLGGLRPHELTLLCAPTGSGKTQLLSNLSAQMAIQDIPHFVAPVETGDTDFVIRTLSSLSGKLLNDGKPIAYDELQGILSRYGKVYLNRPVYLSTYQDRVAVNDMLTLLQFMIENHGIKVALLDNLNFFMPVTSAADQLVAMDNAIHEFVIHAKKFPIHIILIVHPRKTDGGRVESEFDIKGSSTAVQEASNVILFNRPSQKHLDDNIHRKYTDRELVFRKIRKRGQHVGKPIWFKFNNGQFKEEQDI